MTDKDPQVNRVPDDVASSGAKLDPDTISSEDAEATKKDNKVPDDTVSAGVKPDTLSEPDGDKDEVKSEPDASMDDMKEGPTDKEVSAEEETKGTRKRASSRAGKKSKQGDLVEDGRDDEQGQPKKAKKVRVKPEKVKEVYQKILDELVKNYKVGIKEMPLATISSTIGYKHPRSDAIAEAMKLLKKDGLVEKKKEICALAALAVKEYIPETKPAENRDEAWALFWNQFEMKLSSNPKAAGKSVQEASEAIWNKLKDGNAYTKMELVSVTKYKATNSTGFEQIMKTFKELKFTQTENGKVSFTDTLFPFGRP